MSEFIGTTYELPHRPELGKLEVCRFPHRKQIVLAILVDATSEPVAYFRSEDHARMFMEWMSAGAAPAEQVFS